MTELCVVGLDLSGPAGTDRTGVAIFRATGNHLSLDELRPGGDDESLYTTIAELALDRRVVVGIDAPLSYQPGGGMRERDRRLQAAVIDAGLRSGSVMAPTFQKMAYLTLRGVCVARLLAALPDDRVARVVEVHPGATMALRRAPIAAVRGFAKNPVDRADLLRWLVEQGLEGLDPAIPCESHYVAASAAALAAWQWSVGRSPWRWPAEPPWHPYDFAC